MGGGSSPFDKSLNYCDVKIAVNNQFFSTYIKRKTASGIFNVKFFKNIFSKMIPSPLPCFLVEIPLSESPCSKFIFMNLLTQRNPLTSKKCAICLLVWTVTSKHPCG